MRMLRSQYGVLWGVNTGRDPVYLREGLADMFRDDAEAFAPDFTVTMERNIHLADAEGRLMPVPRGTMTALLPMTACSPVTAACWNH